MTKMYLQGSSELGQVTFEVDAPLAELAEVPGKIKAMALPQVEGEMRTQIEANVKIGERTQKVTINCGSNSLSLVIQKLQHFVEEE